MLLPFGFGLRERPADRNANGSVVEIEHVVAGSPAYRAGLRPGVQILAVGGEPVYNLADFERAISKLDVERGLALQWRSTDGRTGYLQLGGVQDKVEP